MSADRPGGRAAPSSGEGAKKGPYHFARRSCAFLPATRRSQIPASLSYALTTTTPCSPHAFLQGLYQQYSLEHIYQESRLCDSRA